MMKNWLAILAAGVALLGASVVPSAAAVRTFALGNLSSALGSAIYVPGTPLKTVGAFTDVFTFTLTDTTDIIGVSFSDTFPEVFQPHTVIPISSSPLIGSLDLFSGAGPGPGSILLELAPIVTNAGTQTQNANLASIILPGGKYFLEVTGATTVGTSAKTPVTYDGTVNISAAVPEPSTWAMIMLGFVGVGLMYGGKRRKQKAIA